MTILNQHDWESYRKSFREAKPFPLICIDNFLDAEVANKIAASYPRYDEALQVGREFSSVNEKKKIQVTDPEQFPAAIAEFANTLASEEFRQRMSDMSGIDDLQWDSGYTGGGMHLTSSSGILDVHVDFNYLEAIKMYRRLNILVYFNPVWEKSWGGAVELWDSKVENCMHSFEPIHNRCVIFETSDMSYHGVTAVATPDNISRNSFAAYYYSDSPGGNKGEQFSGAHSTIFRARPNERLKNYWSMPVESLGRALQEKKKGVKRLIKKVIGRV